MKTLGNQQYTKHTTSEHNYKYRHLNNKIMLYLQVHIKSAFIMNGVCVRWVGWIDLERLDGIGCLEYAEDRAAAEDARLRQR